MIDFLRYRIPIRVKLTLWYVLLLAVTFSAFAFYLIARFQQSLRSAVDTSLQNTVSKTLAALDENDYRETGRMTFDHTGQTQVGTSVFAMRLISLDGTVWDTYNASDRVADWGPAEAGVTSQNGPGEEAEWRILSQPILDSNGLTIGWVQAAQSLTPVIDAVEGLQGQLFLGIPLLLFFAGFGGYFLASRVLRPIEHITDTAREITAQSLSRKIDYHGSADEVGRLAQTFDQMLERLQTSFERERRFTGDAAHELRTPLTVLKGQIEVTLNRRRGPAEYERKLQELSVQVERLIRLSNGLLFLSRSDQHQFSFEPAVINLCELLEILIEQIQPLAHEKEVQVTTKIAEGLPVYGDSDHLISLFMNLFENALKYTPACGQITVMAVKESGKSRVTIHNTGPGIPQEHLEHLFERFYRVDADRSSQTGGSGLGLAIAHEIVNMHGGEIEAQSGPEQGVTVSVRLPLSDS
ncbi:MAG: ATP-binding protein [Anaerolineales bacterium]